MRKASSIILTNSNRPHQIRSSEVGVANKEHSPVDNFLVKHYPYPEKITALGIGDLSGFKEMVPENPYRR